MVTKLVREYNFTLPEGSVVLEAGITADRLAQLRLARQTCDLPMRLKLDRVERQWSQQLVNLLRELFDR